MPSEQVSVHCPSSWLDMSHSTCIIPVLISTSLTGDHETWLLLGDLRSRVDWRKDLVYRQGEAVSEAKHKLGKLERSHGRQHPWWKTMYERYFGDGDLHWAHRSWKHKSNHLQKTKADLSRTRKFQTLVREARSTSIKTKIPVPIEALMEKTDKLRI